MSFLFDSKISNNEENKLLLIKYWDIIFNTSIHFTLYPYIRFLIFNFYDNGYFFKIDKHVILKKYDDMLVDEEFIGKQWIIDRIEDFSTLKSIIEFTFYYLICHVQSICFYFFNIYPFLKILFQNCKLKKITKQYYESIKNIDPFFKNILKNIITIYLETEKDYDKVINIIYDCCLKESSTLLENKNKKRKL